MKLTYPATNWNPFKDIEDIRHQWNAILGLPHIQRPMNGEPTQRTEWRPLVDILEDPQAYTIKVELPEVRKEDIQVEVRDRILTIRGERKRQEEVKGQSYHRIERVYGSFARTFQLPEHVQEDGVKADYKDGVLTVVVPKPAETKPRTVQISVE